MSHTCLTSELLCSLAQLHDDGMMIFLVDKTRKALIFSEIIILFIAFKELK